MSRPDAGRSRLGSATEEQVARVLARLQRGPATTLQLREEEDVLHPAGRVKQLRGRGHDIVTVLVDRQTTSGTWHRVGMYRHRGAATV